MLIFKEDGRLGNQIFQYAALKTLCKPSEDLVLLGFSDFQSVFEAFDARIVNSRNSKHEQLFYNHLYNYVSKLSQSKTVSCISEARESEEPKVSHVLGLFSQITFVEQSFFQSEALFDHLKVDSLRIKPTILKAAKDTLSVLPTCKTPIFVHIRRGDYLNWPNPANPAILPADYYRKCIDIFQSKYSNAFFIFASDDPYYVNDLFGKLGDSYVSRASSYEDFALMTQCKGGILSASSFSWWAAYFSYIRNNDSVFFAPNYWAGHSLKCWYPKFIKTSFLNYIDV